MLRLFLLFCSSYLYLMNIKVIALDIFYCCSYVAKYRKYIC